MCFQFSLILTTNSSLQALSFPSCPSTWPFQFDLLNFNSFNLCLCTTLMKTWCSSMFQWLRHEKTNATKSSVSNVDSKSILTNDKKHCVKTEQKLQENQLKATFITVKWDECSLTWNYTVSSDVIIERSHIILCSKRLRKNSFLTHVLWISRQEICISGWEFLKSLTSGCFHQ